MDTKTKIRIKKWKKFINRNKLARENFKKIHEKDFLEIELYFKNIKNLANTLSALEVYKEKSFTSEFVKKILTEKRLRRLRLCSEFELNKYIMSSDPRIILNSDEFIFANRMEVKKDILFILKEKRNERRINEIKIFYKKNKEFNDWIKTKL